MDETVRLQTDAGVWEVCGADRRRGVWPEDVNCSWDEWGAKTARFTLKREAGAIYPDLGGFTPCVIERGSGVWEGFIDQTPVADVDSLSVEAIGWQDYADDDVLRRLFVHASLGSGWRDIRSYPDTNLDTHRQNGSVEVGDGVIRLALRSGAAVASGDAVAAVFDAGEGNAIKEIAVDATHDVGFAYVGAAMYVLGTDTPYWNGFLHGRADFVSAVVMPNGTYGGVLPGGDSKRFVTILLWNTAGGTPGADITLTISGIRLFAEDAYSTSMQSTLKASTVLRDLLPRLCPQWSQDLSGISGTLLNLPDFAPTQERTFREYVEVLNSLHGYVAKLARGRRFLWKPQPLTPTLTAAPGLGVEFRDASKNATRDLYNKAIGVGTGPDGEPLRVERTAAHQPGVVGELLDVFPNPSFAADTSGWGVITTWGSGSLVRDTGTFESAPAGGRLDVASGSPGVQTTLSGTFKKGVSYRLRFWDGTNAPGGYVVFGDLVAEDWAVLLFNQITPGVPDNNFKTLVWIPKADRTGVQVALIVTGTSRFDTFTLETVRATLLDRRGRWRAKTVSMPSQAMDRDVLAQFADTWLQTHMFTPLRGDVSVSGAAFREYTTGRPIDPFELGEYTTELVHLAGEIDPDKGYLGRTAKVASVSYDGNAESASVSLDANREDFEKIVGRYDVISSGAGPG